MTALRCRPGDLAVVVSAGQTPWMLNRFVIVERLAVYGERVDGGLIFRHAGSPCWIVRSAVKGMLLRNVSWPSGKTIVVESRPFLDSALRPIRPDAGDDETLAWARPPEPAHA